MQRDLPRHFTAYAITFVLYISVIATIFYTQTHTFISSKPTEEKVLKMSLSTFVPEVLPPVEQKVIEPIEEESVVPRIPEPVVEPEPVVKKPVLSPVKKKVKKKPVVKKKPIIKKKIVKTTQKKRPKKPMKKQAKKPSKKKTSQRQTSAKKKASSAGERHTFFNTLRAKIDRHKFYPRIAKKRRMEGSVKVRFTILASGKVGHISVTGAKVFHNSARNAVKSAFPLSTKNIPISLPKTVNITLRYHIR